MTQKLVEKSQVEEPPEPKLSFSIKPKRDETYNVLFEWFVRKYLNNLPVEQIVYFSEAYRIFCENPQRNGELKYKHGLQGEKLRTYSRTESYGWGLFAKLMNESIVRFHANDMSLVQEDFARLHAFWKMNGEEISRAVQIKYAEEKRLRESLDIERSALIGLLKGRC